MHHAFALVVPFHKPSSYRCVSLHKARTQNSIVGEFIAMVSIGLPRV